MTANIIYQNKTGASEVLNFLQLQFAWQKLFTEQAKQQNICDKQVDRSEKKSGSTARGHLGM